MRKSAVVSFTLPGHITKWEHSHCWFTALYMPRTYGFMSLFSINAKNTRDTQMLSVHVEFFSTHAPIRMSISSSLYAYVMVSIAFSISLTLLVLLSFRLPPLSLIHPLFSSLYLSYALSQFISFSLSGPLSLLPWAPLIVLPTISFPFCSFRFLYSLPLYSIPFLSFSFLHVLSFILSLSFPLWTS